MQTLVNKIAAALVEAEKEGNGPGPSTERITVSCWHLRSCVILMEARHAQP